MSLEYYFVFDTNVLVSALLSKNGKARQAFNKARTLGKLLMSESTLLELVTVFARPKLNKYVSSLEKEIFIVTIAKETKVIEIQSEIVVCRDEKDNQYLELAIDGQATCIVSGDSDLLVLNPFREIPILTIQEFLDHDFSRQRSVPPPTSRLETRVKLINHAIVQKRPMPNLTLSNEQVIELVKQLPEAQQQEIYKILILSQWRHLEPVFNEGAERARIVAKERGYDWDSMTEDEREEFIDEIVHERS